MHSEETMSPAAALVYIFSSLCYYLLSLLCIWSEKGKELFCFWTLLKRFNLYNPKDPDRGVQGPLARTNQFDGRKGQNFIPKPGGYIN